MASKAIVTRKNKTRRTVNNDEEEKLQRTILELIKKRLFFAGLLTFHAVCKSWSSINSFPPQKQIPWVIAFHENYGKFKMNENTWSTRWKLVDPTSNKTYNIDMKAMEEKDFNTVRVHESKHGWLFISCRYNQLTHSSTKTSLFLFSPFYKEKKNLIELPDLDQDQDQGNTNICFATFTSNPLEEDCLFVTVIANQNLTGIRTCRRGDESWSYWYCHFPVTKSVSWMCSEGIFYHINDEYEMGKVNFAQRRWSRIPPPPSLSSEDSKPPPLPTAENIYIVKADGEEKLFLVYAPDLKGCFIRYIYRLDLSSMIWERVKSLGDNVLFIGDGYKSVLKPSEMQMKGISPATVYYCGGSNLECLRTVNRILMKDGSYQDDSFDYGSMDTQSCRKIFIDPPPYQCVLSLLQLALFHC